MTVNDGFASWGTLERAEEEINLAVTLDDIERLLPRKAQQSFWAYFGTSGLKPGDRLISPPQDFRDLCHVTCLACVAEVKKYYAAPLPGDAPAPVPHGPIVQEGICSWMSRVFLVQGSTFVRDEVMRAKLVPRHERGLAMHALPLMKRWRTKLETCHERKKRIGLERLTERGRYDAGSMVSVQWRKDR